MFGNVGKTCGGCCCWKGLIVVVAEVLLPPPLLLVGATPGVDPVRLMTGKLRLLIGGMG